MKTEFSLETKYMQESGTVLLSGLQALARLAVDQRRADQQAGLNTAMLISGYRGSPLGELDMTLQSHQDLLDKYHIHFQAAVNEELAATAIYGSQFANLLPEAKYDGVLGMWYGKAPGVDRSGDVFKHANFAGVGQRGGVLALVGDDPAAKSSTLPSHSEVEMWSALMPVLYPGSVQEVLDLGRYGFEMSRYSGLWVGFKIVTNVADGFDTAEVAPDRITIHRPDFTYQGKPWRHTQGTVLLAPRSVQLEKEVYEGRLEAAKAFIAANDLNKITVNPRQAWIGIVASGKTYLDVRQSLWELGLDDNTLLSCGVRLLKISALFPLEPGVVREFAQGLEEILVVEEKGAFIEMFMREILYDQAAHPRIMGKHDERGKVLVRFDGELDSDEISLILASRLKQKINVPSIDARVAQIRAPRGSLTIPLLPRQPYFCSGCPHNRSTVVPEGSLSSAGIGCHTMVLTMPDRVAIGITQMGGEGVNWVGMAPFTSVPHICQNIGDGTLFHSGTLAIRQAIAAKANITYKILYNGAVAMTGGQIPDGNMSVPELTRELQSEGVKRILVMSNEPKKYPRSTHWGPGVEVWDRDRLEEAQEVLSKTPGVTVIIYDQECAAELRRKRKRGLAPDPALRVFINEAVCEGCGDCGKKSNCLSVHPVETELGRKTQIHQSSCNKDYSCLDGNCPAFISVIPDEKSQKTTPAKIYKVEVALPEPIRITGDECNIYLMGIGGTGVVTTNQILGTAALLDGKFIRGLDQTGLSQKGGPVVSHLKVLNDERETSNKLAVGEADCYLVFDMLTGANFNNLSLARSDKTVAIVSTSEVPTGAMVSSTKVAFPGAPSLLTAIEDCTRKDHNIYLDAIGLAEALFDSHMAANMIIIGAAYQSGLFPFGADAIEHAIELNGTFVAMNIQAFRVGRRAVAEPAWVTTIDKHRHGELPVKPVLTGEAQRLIAAIHPTGELARLLEIRVPELIAYQNIGYAQKHLDFVAHVRDIEAKTMPSDTRLSEAVARYLFKLMAYKDEYEVARLSLKPELSQTMRDLFGAEAQIHYKLHPPILKAFGLKNKISLGTWFNGVFRLLMAMKVLRFTPFDIFGYDKIRRIERALIGQYRDLIEEALSTLSPATYENAVKLAELPDMIRGYDDVKLGNVDLFWQEVGKLGFGTPHNGAITPIKAGAGD